MAKVVNRKAGNPELKPDFNYKHLEKGILLLQQYYKSFIYSSSLLTIHTASATQFFLQRKQGTRDSETGNKYVVVPITPGEKWSLISLMTMYEPWMRVLFNGSNQWVMKSIIYTMDISWLDHGQIMVRSWMDHGQTMDGPWIVWT